MPSHRYSFLLVSLGLFSVAIRAQNTLKHEFRAYPTSAGSTTLTIDGRKFQFHHSNENTSCDASGSATITGRHFVIPLAECPQLGKSLDCHLRTTDSSPFFRTSLFCIIPGTQLDFALGDIASTVPVGTVVPSMGFAAQTIRFTPATASSTFLLRSGPSANSKPALLNAIQAGTSINLIAVAFYPNQQRSSKDSWYYIHVQGNGEGWVSGAEIRID